MDKEMNKKIEEFFQKDINSCNPKSVWWNCSECGHSLFAIEFEGQWYEKDTSRTTACWERLVNNLEPDWDHVECGCE